MHVAFFNRSYYPDTTATGQLLTELCEGLVAAHGCWVSVVADGATRGLLQREAHRGVEILRAGCAATVLLVETERRISD